MVLWQTNQSTSAVLLHVLLHVQGGRVGIGIIAALRFISGAAASNSAPAALAYLLDRAPQCPNLHASCVPAAMAAGACMASGPALFLSWVMSPAVLGASGWRVVLVLSLLSNAVAGALRGWGLQDPEQHMQAAELADRSNVHVWRIVRWVSLMTGAAVDRYKLAAI
jgi:MFS family permease